MSATMEEVVVVVQKTAEELRREIDELQRQQREVCPFSLNSYSKNRSNTRWRFYLLRSSECPNRRGFQGFFTKSSMGGVLPCVRPF